MELWKNKMTGNSGMKMIHEVYARIDPRGLNCKGIIPIQTQVYRST